MHEVDMNVQAGQRGGRGLVRSCPSSPFRGSTVTLPAGKGNSRQMISHRARATSIILQPYLYGSSATSFVRLTPADRRGEPCGTLG